MTTRIFQFSVSSSSLPAWVPSTVGQWVQISTSNTISSVQPSPTPPGNTGPSSVTDTWCCIASSASGDVYMWGGGHADYSGNEVYRLRLNQATPVYQRLSTPTASVTTNVKYYGDGRPSARHTYQSFWFAGGKLKSLGGQYVYGNASVSPSNTDIFDPDTGNWTTQVNNNGSGWYACGNHATGVIYVAGPSGNYSSTTYGRLDASNVWTTLGSGSSSGTAFGGSAFDSARSRIYRIGDYDGNKPVVYWTVGGSETNPALSGANASTFDNFGSYAGVDYCVGSDCIYLKDPGANRTVYRLNCATLACDTLTTSGATPSSAMNGVNGRFKYVPDLKGFIYIPSWGVAYFLRTHA